MASSSEAERAAKEDLPDDCEPDAAEKVLTETNPSLLAEFNEIVSRSLSPCSDGICTYKRCRCRPPRFVKLTTFWDNYDDRGRRVYKCANRNGITCGYFEFKDPPLTGPALNLVNCMYHRIRMLDAVICVLKHNETLPESVVRSYEAYCQEEKERERLVLGFEEILLDHGY